MPYRLFVPKAYDKASKYPLVLWLHGAGAVGSDNFRQISGDQIMGTRTWTRPEVQAKYPAFVLVPQTLGSWSISGGDVELPQGLTLVLEILESLKAEFSIDPQRLYVAGQSMGGNGAWLLITVRPDLFAAAIPLCGGGDPTRAAAIAKMPVWAFHGDRDLSIPVSESRKMIQALRKAGGKPRYTEYRRVGHDVWLTAFKEPELVDWVFAQRR